MNGFCVSLCLSLAVASTGAAQLPPPELAALAASSGLEGPVTAWCRGQFQAGRPDAFAVAVPAAGGGGRYLVIEGDGTVAALAAFTRGAELSCHTRAAAEELSVVIGRSDTIDGRIAPRWDTTVVCGFVDDTTAVCWQRSPDDGEFVAVGGWVT